MDRLHELCYEAAAAQPGSSLPTAEELDDWFWGETAAAKVLFAVKDRCLKKDDNNDAANWQNFANSHVAKRCLITEGRGQRTDDRRQKTIGIGQGA